MLRGKKKRKKKGKEKKVLKYAIYDRDHSHFNTHFFSPPLRLKFREFMLLTCNDFYLITLRNICSAWTQSMRMCLEQENIDGFAL